MERKLVFNLFLVTCGWATLDSAYNMLVLWFDAIGFSAGPWLGAILGASYGVAMVCRLVAPLALDRIGLVCGSRDGYGLAALATVLIVVMPHGTIKFLLCRMLYGVGQTLMLVALMSIQVAAFDEENRGRAMTLISLGNVLPVLFSLPLFEWTLQSGHPGLYGCGAIGVSVLGLMAVCGLRLLPQSAEEASRSSASSPAGSYGQVLRSESLRRFFMVLVVFAVLDAMQVSLVFVARERGLLLSAFLVASSLASVVMRTGGARLVNTFPRRRLAVLPAFGLAASLAGATWATGVCSMAFWGVCYGLTMGLGYPMLLSLMGDMSAPHLHTRVVGIYGLLYSGAYGVTPVIVTALGGLMSYGSVYRTMTLALVVLNVLIWKFCAFRLPNSGK